MTTSAIKKIEDNSKPLLEQSVKEDLIRLLVNSGVVTFGEFLTKSGRTTPYFLNFGKIANGVTLHNLGEFYAKAIIARYGSSVSVVFGPAYKGISLSVATSYHLTKLLGKDVSFCFNRKEQKTHGDKGITVGKKLIPGDKIVIVEDVITAGTTVREIVPLIENFEGVSIAGMFVAVDRLEKVEISDRVTAREKIIHEMEIDICSLINIKEIITYLSSENPTGVVLTKEQVSKAKDYIRLYGTGE